VEDLSDGRRRVVAQAGPQRRLREREDLGPPFGERAVALGRDPRIGRLDDAADPHRELDELAHVRLALRLVGVEQRLAACARADEPELPREIRGIADPGAHALTEKGRRLVRGVAGDQEPAPAPAAGDHRVEGVDGGPLDLRVRRGEPAR